MPDTYTSDRTRHLRIKQTAPHGETRTLTYVIRGGVEYTIVPDEELGTLPVSQVRNEISESAVPTENATEAARELAEKEGIDLGTIDGTGADGRITKSDVQQALGS